MAFAQGRFQSGVLRGPQGRQAPLNGITMAGSEVKGLQLVAGPDRSGLVLWCVSMPRWLDVLAAAGQPERLRDTGQPAGSGGTRPAPGGAQVSA